MTIEAVIFDAVGTLFHSEPGIIDVYSAVGRRWGASLNPETIAARFTPAFFRHFGRPQRGDSEEATATSEELEKLRWRRVVGDVFVEYPGSHERLFDDLWDHFAHGAAWRLFPDVEPAWRELERRGLIVGIGSNYDERLFHVIRELPPLDTCRHVFHSAGVGQAKPGRGFFRAIEERLGLSPSQLLFVGDDRTNDYEGALAAGWKALWLTRRSANLEAGRISTLDGVLAYLNSILWESGDPG